MNIDCELTIANCTIIGNRAEAGGGGMWCEGFGGCSYTITNCRFIANTSDVVGGGVCLEEESSPTMTNCLFAGNSAMFAGAIYVEGYPRIENCTFAGNRALSQCGGVKKYGGAVLFRNCILWGNSDTFGNTESAQIQPGDDSHIDYCCIQGWTGTLGGVGNNGDDPCFASPGWWDQNGTLAAPNDDLWADGDYHLKSQAGRWNAGEGRWAIDEVTSPCIDAGDPLNPIGLEPFPNGGIVNMGAYGGTAEASKSYFGKPPCKTIVPGDINGDCIIDFRDFCMMALHWCEDHNL